MANRATTNTSAGTSPVTWVRRGLWAVVALAAVGFTVAQLVMPKNAPNTADIGGPYTLTDHTGTRVTESAYHGKIQVIYFGFTHCPDICPTSVQLIAAAVEKLDKKSRAQVQPLLITLDPERDTPEVMKEYVKYFLPGMVGLTGSLQEITDTAKAYRIAFWKVKDPNSSLPYTIDHASIIYLMDKKGQFIRHFGQDATADDLAVAIKSVL